MKKEKKPVRVSVIYGTRPEAIKLAPVILQLRKEPDIFSCKVCITAQHREMLDQVNSFFGIKPDTDLDLMEKDQTLTSFTSKAITRLDIYLKSEKPDMVIIQGDTTTVFCAALVAFYNHIPVAHVEAGLRTGNIYAPFPEEINRTLASRLTTLHFAPTESGRQNLIREGIPAGLIHVTGNTVIDALFLTLEKLNSSGVPVPGLDPELTASFRRKPMVLITGHRRENFGQGFENICLAIRNLALEFPEVHFVYPVHLNPNVQEPVNRLLGDPVNKNIHLLQPLTYPEFISLMSLAKIILTDSGGIQEEAPSLGKPVLVMREVTERPEAVEAGTVKLVGTETGSIMDGITELLTNSKSYRAMARAINPYGDGMASQRIARIIHEQFSR